MYNIIIIEDDPMVMDINCGYVQKCKSVRVVKTFRDGKDALDYIASGEPVDLIILDIYMPRMNGIEFLKTLRGSGNNCSVIPVTAANERETVEQIVGYNVIDYLVKPFGEKRLQQAISKFVAYKEVLKKAPPFSQGELDEIFHPRPVATGKTDKTIDPRTLKLISDYMQNNKPRAIPIKEIAEAVSLTSVTVRRYLNHLIGEGVVRTELDYSTGGKPAVLYICN